MTHYIIASSNKKESTTKQYITLIEVSIFCIIFISFNLYLAFVAGI
jgi:hypothetical protein